MQERTVDTHCKMHESQNNYAEGKEPDQKREQTMWFHWYNFYKMQTGQLWQKAGHWLPGNGWRGERKEGGNYKEAQETFDEYFHYHNCASFTGVDMCQNLSNFDFHIWKFIVCQLHLEKAVNHTCAHTYTHTQVEYRYSPLRMATTKTEDTKLKTWSSWNTLRHFWWGCNTHTALENKT